ncbi:MAG: major capsid protein [Cressdnaviricota sp.]|nr:MAG: major capsid protein [Cressdnaviricota sp.]
MKLIRHNHDLSFTHMTSFAPGKLIPVAHVEILPGDTINMKTSAFLRVEPLNKPMIHEVEMRIHHWFVPNRIIWDGWENFITGRTPVTTASLPKINVSQAGNYEIIDHCGGNPIPHTEYSDFPIRCYNTIWNEFYRDQEVQNPLTDTQIEEQGALKSIAWNKDYFTTARKLPQQGSSINVQFTGDSQLPVQGLALRATPNNASATWVTPRETGNRVPDTFQGWLVNPTSTPTAGRAGLLVEESSVTEEAGFPAIYTDLSASSLGINIDDLRKAMATQRIAEARALFGDRYTDYLAYYGVKSSDARLQRPEYLGGFTKRVHFSEVLGTGDTDTGKLVGHGIAHKSGGRFRKMFEEHGTLMSLMSVRPLAMYQQGRPRKFNRRTPLDFWTREFENTPWQEIRQSEIYSDVSNSDSAGRTGTSYSGDPTFGYTSRFDEYRESPNIVTGALRRSATTPVAGDQTNYHWARWFTTAQKPTIVDSTFITCAPTAEVFQGTQTDPFIVHLTHSIKAKRLVSSSARIQHAL